jgi:hypothetical protein
LFPNRSFQEHQMNASRFLVSAATALSLAGAIGFAYAQTTSPSGQSTASPSGNSGKADPRMQNPGNPKAMEPMGTQAPMTTQVQPSPAPSAAPGASMSTPTMERAPRAARN